MMKQIIQNPDGRPNYVMITLIAIIFLQLVGFIMFSGKSDNKQYACPAFSYTLPDRSAAFVPRPFIMRDYKFYFDKIKNHTLKIPPKWWPYALFESVYECTMGEDRIGYSGDGGKWICGMSNLLQKPNCVVYSMGSNGKHDFEDVLLHHTQCEIHTFDMDDYSYVFEGTRVKFHTSKIGDGTNGTETIAGWMKKLGHDHLDVLKIDIESSEYAAFGQLQSEYPIPWIGQILIEVHVFGVNFPNLNGKEKYKIVDNMVNLFSIINGLGLYQFHREENPRLSACEYSFGNLMPRPPV